MRHRTRRAFVVAVLTAAVVSVVLGSGNSNALAKGAVNTIGSPGVAIKGFDAVAYFKDGRSRRGAKVHAFRYKGVEWHFSSAENMAAFAANPSKYEPAYGGYCAYGVASGYLVKIEGDAWAIRDGRLYLNYDDGVQKKWSHSPGAFIREANRKWRAIKPTH
jgi:hypothetical protein